MIGTDFPRNDFEFFGWHLTDPTDFGYNLILGILSLYFASKLSRISLSTKFYSNWKLFFLFFGIASLNGAFSHLFYNYCHYYGKIFGWLLVPIAIYSVEMAMLEVHWNPKVIKRGKILYKIKLALVYIAFFLVWMNTPVYEKPQLLFLPIAINTIIGLLAGVGIFSYKYIKKISPNFRYIFLGIVVVVPSAFVFLFKINPHPWFNKNDISHMLMVIATVLFYKGVNALYEENKDNPSLFS